LDRQLLLACQNAGFFLNSAHRQNAGVDPIEAEHICPVSSSSPSDRQSKLNLTGKKKGISMTHPMRLKTTASPFLTALMLFSFALLPKVEAVNPAPDGGYPGFNSF
jgi:hypothetical protein